MGNSISCGSLDEYVLKSRVVRSTTTDNRVLTTEPISRDVVYVNLGLYRTGSTTLAKAAEVCGLKVHRDFPQVDSATHKRMLKYPSAAVYSWWISGGKEELLELVKRFDFLGDGYVPLLCFLPPEEIKDFVKQANSNGKRLAFLETRRELPGMIKSELHHWDLEDLERKAGLDQKERDKLEWYLSNRAKLRENALKCFPVFPQQLPLEEISQWPKIMTSFCASLERRSLDWKNGFATVGRNNASPQLPVEGILLTLRVGKEAQAVHSLRAVENLLNGIDKDTLCEYLVVLAVDEDEANSLEVKALEACIRSHTPRVYIIENALPNAANGNRSQTFQICDSWNRMAIEAFQRGADWVMLLGDDVDVKCSFHYRAFYRAFLDVQERCGTPFGFGCPWWNDESFPGFPTFPVVGKIHHEIFNASFIPPHRQGYFINQDLDPYIQRLYLQFGAAPLVSDALLCNGTGGNNVRPPRYLPVVADGWRDWVLDDVQAIRTYLHSLETRGHLRGALQASDIECILVDVVVPSYRVSMEYLEGICKLTVPANLRTTFIIVIDNPELLKERMSSDSPNEEMSADDAASCLESHLAKAGGNNVRVRCNSSNLGASATRNRGLEESSATFVLFLDDDVTPDQDLLCEYGQAIKRMEPMEAGLVGLVEFPRSALLPIVHAGVLMSYLTFMFEIAGQDWCEKVQWGVTANILVRRLSVRFDTDYAKTGGGEDVDFCLRVLDAWNRARGSSRAYFRCVPAAKVTHEFWPGGLKTLLPHFFNWAIGDGALFTRHEKYTYSSYANAVEFFAFLFLPVVMVDLFLVQHMETLVLALVAEVIVLFLVDLGVDMCYRGEFKHRCKLLQLPEGNFVFSWHYHVMSHAAANMFVLVLESGRLYGHWKRGELWMNVTRRFDWHCGRLVDAPKTFVQRERIKFGLSLVFTFASLAAAHAVVEGLLSLDPSMLTPESSLQCVYWTLGECFLRE